jgi:hypothetical protein
MGAPHSPSHAAISPRPGAHLYRPVETPPSSCGTTTMGTGTVAQGWGGEHKISENEMVMGTRPASGRSGALQGGRRRSRMAHRVSCLPHGASRAL